MSVVSPNFRKPMRSPASRGSPTAANAAPGSARSPAARPPTSGNLLATPLKTTPDKQFESGEVAERDSYSRASGSAVDLSDEIRQLSAYLEELMSRFDALKGAQQRKVVRIRIMMATAVIGAAGTFHLFATCERVNADLEKVISGLFLWYSKELDANSPRLRRQTAIGQSMTFFGCFLDNLYDIVNYGLDCIIHLGMIKTMLLLMAIWFVVGRLIAPTVSQGVHKVIEEFNDHRKRRTTMRQEKRRLSMIPKSRHSQSGEPRSRVSQSGELRSGDLRNRSRPRRSQRSQMSDMMSDMMSEQSRVSAMSESNPDLSDANEQCVSSGGGSSAEFSSDAAGGSD